MATFLTLRTDFFGRGFDHYRTPADSLAQANRWINQAYLKLCEEALWPFLLATATGSAPLAVADLRAIRTVKTAGVTRPLDPIDEDELADGYDLTTTGTPTWFYVDNLTVRTYPVGGTLTVRYWKVPAVLAADGDTALIPDRFCDAIVDRAVMAAAREDAPEAAAAARASYDDTVDLMRRSLLLADGVRHYQRQSADHEDR